jgi:MinD-like ATPase involved in chromosome partitioning or flagellar assembly
VSGRIIAVSGGDGVGKSTVCANLASLLSEDDKLVIVFGTRTDYPSIQSYFNILVPEERSLKKLYEDVSMDLSIDIKDYLVQYKNSNVFILTVPDNTKALTLADENLMPTQQQCKNIILSLQQLCDYLIIDCDTNIRNAMSAWGQNYADIVLHIVKLTQQGLRFTNAYMDYYNEIWRGKVIHIANADKNYIGTKKFENAVDVGLHFDLSLPYDEQVELSENTGVPAIENYHKLKLFSENYRSCIFELMNLVSSTND